MAEKKLRQVNEQKIMQKIKDITDEGRDALESERDQRDRSEEAMIGLLEETCRKLNQIKI